jgi:hypothetical protein
MLVEMAMDRIFLIVSSDFSLLIIIPPFLYTHLLPSHKMWDISDQAAQYHIFDIKISGFISLPAYGDTLRTLQFLVYKYSMTFILSFMEIRQLILDY